MSQNPASEPVSQTKFYEYINNLVTFEPLLYDGNFQFSRNLRLFLSITFTTNEEKIDRSSKSSINIIYAIKRGNLHLNLTNGRMSFNKRKSFGNEIDNWRGIHKGSPEAPQWEFTITENSKRYLYGELKEKCLGFIELLELGDFLELEAIFKISVNRNYIEIIDSDDSDECKKNKKQKESKIALLLQFLQDKYKLENYVSKVVVTYGKANIS